MLTYICFPPVGLECQLQFIFLCRPCVCGFRNLEGEGKERGEREGIKKEEGGEKEKERRNVERKQEAERRGRKREEEKEGKE